MNGQGDDLPIEAALILAAGRGSRLLPHTRDVPKCLLDLGDCTILDYQLERFRAVGVRDVILVAGYRSDLVRAACAARPEVTVVENPDYAVTNSLHSLSLAQPLLRDRGFYLCNGDVVFHPEILELLAGTPEPAALTLDSASELDEEEMKVRLSGRRVAEISKALPVARAHGESLGLLKFAAAAGTALLEAACQLVRRGQGGDWAPRAFNEVLDRHPLAAIDIGDRAWVEVDTPEDLERARAFVYPVCRLPRVMRSQS